MFDMPTGASSGDHNRLLDIWIQSLEDKPSLSDTLETISSQEVFEVMKATEIAYIN